MINSLDQLFYEPIEESNNFRFLKENITYQDFINIYIESSSDEEKINLLKSLISIFSHEKSFLNICYFCLINNKLKEAEFQLDEELENSNISAYLSKKNFFHWIISHYFFEKNDEIKQYLTKLFFLIISVFGINKYDISNIYEELSKIYFYSDTQNNENEEEANNDININNFYQHLQFLSIAYGINMDKNDKNLKKNRFAKPYNFYFFKGIEYIKINPTISSNEKSKINDGISIFICFKNMLNPKYMKKINNKKSYDFCSIFNMNFNNGYKLLLKIDNNMNLCLNLSSNKNSLVDEIIITKIEDNEWYNLCINMNLNKKNKKFNLNITINNNIINNVKDLFFENAKINEINSIILCENFIGFITNFILYNKLVEKDTITFYQNKFKFGLYKFSHVNKFLSQFNQNNIKNLIIFLIPADTYGSDELINLANSYVNNKLTNNFDIKYISSTGKINYANININHRFNKKINLLGGIESLLPFVEILIKISKKENISDELPTFQNSLLIILNIINSILIDNKANLIELSKSNFIEILSTFLQNLNIASYDEEKKEIFNDKIAQAFIDLASYLFNNSEKFEKILISFLDNFLFNVKIINKFSLPNQNLIFNFLCENISKININSENNINPDNIIFILQYYNETYKNFFCCDEHKNFYGEKKKKIDLKTPFDSLTKIFGSISKYNEDIYIKIMHFFVIRSKPCLVKLVIKNIFIINLKKNDINKTEKNKFVKYLVKNNLLNTLLFLMSTYIYPDIINEIITLLSIISLQSKLIDNTNNFFNKENNIHYISKSILPIYIRINSIKEIHNESNEQTEKNLNLKNKKIAQSEILFLKDDCDKEDENNNDFNDDFNEDYDLLAANGNMKFNFSEKGRKNKRKKTSDNFHISKFNLDKVNTIDLGELPENNQIAKKINFENEDDGDFPQVFRSPRKLNSVVESVINFARIDNKKIKNIFQKPSVESMYEDSLKEYKKLNPILDKLNEKKISLYINNILESLINWLKTDFSNYVIKIISNFFSKNKIEYIHIYKFIETLNTIINEQIYTKKSKLTTQLFNLEFYFWYTDCMFQFYLAKNKKKELISSNNVIIFPENHDSNIQNIIESTVKKGMKILISLIINIKIEKNELNKLFDILLLCGTRIKKYYSFNKNTIIYLNNFYSEFFTDMLKEYNKYYSSANSEQLMPIINICYEYILFFNNENKSEEINNFMINDNQIFSGIILSGINTNNIVGEISNIKISKFWTDYQLFIAIMKVLKQIINIDNIDYKDDKYLEENILSHKKSDMFLDQIYFLCNCPKSGNNMNSSNNNTANNSNNNNINLDKNETDIKNGELPLIYIISNLYVVTLNLANIKSEKEEILKDYKTYIIFLILASSNLSSSTPMVNTIQNKVELIINYFIGFIIERYNNGLDRDLLIPCLNEVFILMIKILKRTYDQTNKRKSSKIFNKIITTITVTQKKIDFSKCAVFKILLRENMSNVFNKDFVYTMKKNSFQYFNDKSYLIQLLLSCIDLKSIKKEIKHIFFAGKYLQKGHQRVSEINEMKLRDNSENEDGVYDFQFFKMRRKIAGGMENGLSALDEEIKLYKEKRYLAKEKIKLLYKKIKKKLFSFCGIWSNKNIFYNKDINDDEGSSEDFEEKEYDSENSLDEVINKQKNKYINKHLIKYKLTNHYSKNLLRPILTPIYDINEYLPIFSLFKKNNLFIETQQNKKMISIIDLNMNKIFNEEEDDLETFELLEAQEEETDSVILSIFKENFPNIYNIFINKVEPNLCNDKLMKPPLSGFILKSHVCCYVIQMSHIKGFFYLDKNFCCFIQNFYEENSGDNIGKNRKYKDEDFDDEKKMCYGSYLKLNKNKYVYFKIKYNDIQLIFLRKYYYKNSAIEIFTSKNKVYYLNFPDSTKRQNALNLLLSKFSTKKEIKISKNKILGYDLSSSDNNHFNINNNNTSVDFITNIVENWQDWNISTMELILWLNTLSNRSFNDITQYPVFPWILTQYEDDYSQNKEIASLSLSKSYMPGMITSKTNLKDTNVIGKSNSGETKEKKRVSNFFKGLRKKKSDKDNKDKDTLNKITIDSGKNVNNINNIDINEKRNYDQFPVDKNKYQIILEKDIRNFSLPMGMMTLNENGEKRKSNYIMKFTVMKKEINDLNQKENKNTESSSDIPKLYIYGSHYSNPLYVCHYLIRIFPFSNIGIELQGDKFDDPNRMLVSVSKSFEGSASHEGDVRELCPEFYYLPEIFENKNNLDLKIKSKQNKNKNQSNNVILPNWANNNNYIFITKLKTYLESEEVNKNINKWFDLIFGYKQKGKDAEAAYNLLLPSSYDNFDIKKEAKTADQKIYFLRLTEFGLTPHQIINKKFNQRKAKDNKKKTISESWREKEPIINQFENKKNENKTQLRLLKIKFIDDENFYAVFNNYQFIKNEFINFQNVSEHSIQFDSNSKFYIKKDCIYKYNLLKVKKNKIMNKSYPIIIYKKGAYIAEGGYYDGIILVTQLSTKTKSIKTANPESVIIQTFEVKNTMDSSPIIVLIITKDEKYIFAGSMLGSIVIYKNNETSWKKKYQINDHYNAPITSLYHNDILNLWGSSGYDGYINLYTFPSNKKISSIKLDEDSIIADYIFISSSPLPCFIVYCKNNYTFYTYSLIGNLICKICEIDSEIFSPKIIRESNFGEVLIYGNDKGQINMRFLPSLDLFLSRGINGGDNYSYLNIDLIDISNNGWYCIAWNNDNNIFYAMNDPSHISEKEELMIFHLVNDLDE